MDALGDEVSSKIRLAIKTKLQELNAYVDDELPDYIMVMVANKKGADVMRKDLGLFLNERTDEFVDWLVGVLHRLEKVTLGGKLKKKKSLAGAKKKTPATAGAAAKSKEDKKKKKKDKAAKKASKKKEKDEEKKKSRRSSSLTKKRKGDRSASPQQDRKSKQQRPDKQADRSPSPPPRSRSPRRHDHHDRRDHGQDSHHDRREHDHHHDKRDHDVHHDRRDHHDLGRRRDHHHQRRASENEHNRTREHPHQHHRRSPSPRRGRDSEYDPEKLLKKAVCSTVKVVENKKSWKEGMKAVSEADKRDDLDEVHARRRKLSEAMRRGQLDKTKIEQINKDLQHKPEVKKTPPDPEKRAKRHSSPSKRRTDSPDKKKRKDSDSGENLLSKKAGPAVPVENLGSGDLRHRLGPRRVAARVAVDNSVTKSSILNKDPKFSGLTVQISNDYRQERQDSDEKERRQSRERRQSIERPPRLSEEDIRLEKMRQRALESMGRRRESAEYPRTSPQVGHHHHHHHHHHHQSLEKKIIIPLNDDSSDEDNSDIEHNDDVFKAKDDDSSSSNSDSDSDSDSSSSDDSSEEEEQESKNDPTFIVTLEGIDKAYFKQQRQKSMEEAVAAPIVEASPPQQNKAKSTLRGAAGATNVVRKPVVLNTVIAKDAKPRAEEQKSNITPTAEKGSPVQKKVVPPQQPVAAAKKEKPTAPVAPLAARVKPPPPQTAAKPAQQPPVKKPEAKVAPVSRRPPPKPITAPTSTTKRTPITAPPSEKPKRARITAPEPDPDTSKDSFSSSLSTTSYSGTAGQQQEVCRFWPRCSRGDQCFYLHPTTPAATRKPYARQTSAPSFYNHYQHQQGGRGSHHQGLSGRDKFKWTSASILP